MIDPQTLTLKLPHLDVTALSWGPPDGRLVLCLHGFPDSAWGWRKMAPLLAEQGLWVVAPFSRGYAPTGPAPDGGYHIGALMYDALAVHGALGAPADAVVIGHDWGAFTASALAAYPDSPFAVHVTMAVAPVGVIGRARGSVVRQLRMLPRQLRNSWYILFFQLPEVPERLLSSVIPRLWRDWGPPGYRTEAELSDALAALPSPAHRKAAVGYYRALVRPGRPAPRYADLHKWSFEVPRRPLLHLQGEQDGAMLPEYAESVKPGLPAGSEVQMIPSAGHFLQIERPDVTAEAVLAYLGAR
ncbi:putative hydrolase or acyltransferase of alpha/beta superfamily [Mycolicibacterium chubuense NBB4]|uniref:Putative hydrolase or acyltransferase of alpha/beta superfamily n=1 Tax=Mycolicibacterium chubuense (strain NBB4) TaxID=710421 RepID=I4BDF0_MYCCN|nr:alpha/beta fold hydrolase [Mycolicibacterium chubuense]AFM15307.1 putative hydrolase or acyltransferase of alpha/beta superfamily [Mycolicibacterium chubuense NBB4]